MSPSNDIIYNNDRFTDEKYEVLFCSGLPQSFNDSYDHVVQTINGADVSLPYRDLKYKIDWQEKGKVIDEVKICSYENNLFRRCVCNFSLWTD